MDTEEQQLGLTNDDPSLLSPRNINLYRLRQASASMILSTAAGFAGWFTWIGLRSSDEKLYLLCAYMGFVLGAILLVVGLFSTMTVFVQSVYCQVRFRFGLNYLVVGLLVLPVFVVPYFIH